MPSSKTMKRRMSKRSVKRNKKSRAMKRKMMNGGGFPVPYQAPVNSIGKICSSYCYIDENGQEIPHKAGILPGYRSTCLKCNCTM